MDIKIIVKQNGYKNHRKTNEPFTCWNWRNNFFSSCLKVMYENNSSEDIKGVFDTDTGVMIAALHSVEMKKFEYVGNNTSVCLL